MSDKYPTSNRGDGRYKELAGYEERNGVDEPDVDQDKCLWLKHLRPVGTAMRVRGILVYIPVSLTTP